MSRPIFGVKEPNWQKHLRPDNKEYFWNLVRETYKKVIKEEIETWEE